MKMPARPKCECTRNRCGALCASERKSSQDASAKTKHSQKRKRPVEDRPSFLYNQTTDGQKGEDYAVVISIPFRR